MTVTLHHPNGVVSIDQIESGKNRISVNMLDMKSFIPLKTLETAYPVALINSILTVKGPAWLCDEIQRDEGADVSADLKYGLLSFVGEEDFEGKRILDFGCGCGASTMILARMFPICEIVGIELEGEFLKVAKLRAAHYGVSNVKFALSKSGDNIPDDMGDFDYVTLSGVYEHLLPKERQILLPKIWKSINAGGILFINQTPHRYTPFDIHTTGLPLISYLPDRMTLRIAKWFSNKVDSKDNWETLLRRGIRGGTEKEITKILTSTQYKPICLQPNKLGMKDQIDIFCKLAYAKGRPLAGKLVYYPCKLLKALVGIAFVPTISVALKKPGIPGESRYSNE